MKKGLYAAVSAALISAFLCGCSEQTSKKPIPLESISSNQPNSNLQSGTLYQTPDISQIIQTKPAATSSSSSSAENVWNDITQSEEQSEPAITSESQSESSPSQQYTPTPTPRFTSSSRSSASQQTPVQRPESGQPQPTEPTSTPISTPVSSSSVQQTAPISTSTPQSSSEPNSAPSLQPNVSGSVLNDYTSKWAYNRLSAKQQETYDRLFECAQNIAVECDISDLELSANDLFAAYWAFDYDNPQFLELGSGYTYNYTRSNGRDRMKNIKINYSRSSEQVPQSEFDSVAQSVIAEAQSKASDYEKLKYVHDWIVNNTVYTNTNTDYESEADGPVIYGKAICEGYSKAFMYFSQSMGFESVCVVGSAGGEDHMWNMVSLNGQWYHVDVTWDDPVRSDGTQTLRDDYFLISESQIRQDHVIDSPFTLPSAPNSYI